MAKLTTSDITTRNAAIVRDFAAGGVTKAALAKKYGVDEKTIRRAIKAAGAAKPAKTDVKSSVKAKAQKAVGKSSKAGVQTCAKDAAQPSAKSGQKTDPTSLAVGYKVRMSEAGKKRWGVSHSNPDGINGEVTSTGASRILPYEVKWDNGCVNAYYAGDLELVEEPKALPVAVTSPATGVKAALASGQEVAYIITGDSIVMTLGNDTEIVDSSHANYQPIKVAIVSGDFKTAYDLMNISRAIESFTQGAIKIVGGEMYYGEMLLKSALVDRILAMMGEGDEGFKKLVAFMERLLNNPSQRSVQELWGFISHLDIEITADGYIVGWKKVKSRDGRLFDSHTGKVPNDIGNIVEMPRFMVDDNKNQTCSQGLHVGAWDYVSSFSGDTILKVLVDPADVVSVPTDYNDMKMRAAKYTVLTAVDSNRKEVGVPRNKNVKRLHVKVGERGEILSSVEI